jgi:hypothetical protein
MAVPASAFPKVRLPLVASSNRLLKNHCAILIRACAVLGILMYSLCALRFLRSGRARLKAARDVFQQPANP